MTEEFINSENFIKAFGEGRCFNAFEYFGCKKCSEGYRFAVWAPGVRSVAVTGDFCGWKEDAVCLSHVKDGVWEAVTELPREGSLYKFVIITQSGEKLYKADPFAMFSEMRPGTASVVHTAHYSWNDSAYMAERNERDHFKRPKNIYEIHLGSWKKNGEEFLSYEELADILPGYLKKMGYNYAEFMPVTEHPFDGSWGYQSTAYFSATSRYGKPEGLMKLIDACHEKGIGVILDWVPAHFCKDAHGLGRFNGEMLYEKKEHLQWGTYVFDYGRPQVRSFLISSAMFWLKEYHADGIRVDGVSSMLYLNYGVEDPKSRRYNEDGSEDDREAVRFLRELSEAVGRNCPGCFLCAEESTAWPLVTYPPESGGLGFHYKWDMGWMNDTLSFMKENFPARKYHFNKLTFSMMYSFSENFILPFSHDEVVHGKASLINKMPGLYEEKFLGLKLLAVYQMSHPGAKLNFMGNEFAQFIEWDESKELDWFLLDYPAHREYRDFIRKLNRIYLKENALWSDDKSWEGFRWIDADNSRQCVLSYVRQSAGKRSQIIAVLNFENVKYGEFRIGVPKKGTYTVLISTRGKEYEVKAENIPFHGMKYSVCLELSELEAVLLKRKQERKYD